MAIKRPIKKEQPKDVKDLNSTFVNGLFEECVATSSTSKDKTQPSILFPKEAGFTVDEQPIYFNKEKINDKKSIIRYLYGQLKAVHQSQSHKMTAEDCMTKYSGEAWTSDKRYSYEISTFRNCS